MCKSQGMHVNTELRVATRRVCSVHRVLRSSLVGPFGVSVFASRLLKFLVHHLSSLFVSPLSHNGSTGWVSVEAGHIRGEYFGFLGTSVKDLRS